MARLNQVRLKNGIFPFQCEIETRFGDVDVQHHINNVAATDIIQEGRVRMAYKFDFASVIQEQRLVVASMTFEFASEMLHPAPVLVSSGVLEIGRTSYLLGQLASQNGTICAYAEIVQVASDNKGAAPFNPEWRAALERLMITHPPSHLSG